MTLGIGETGEKTDQDVLSCSPVAAWMWSWQNENNVWKKGNEGLIVEAKKISFLFSPELLLSAVTVDERPLNILFKE